jgi:hypothetical protein
MIFSRMLRQIAHLFRPRPGLPRVSPRLHTEALGTRLIRTIQETRFESFKLKPVDKKVLFLLIFAQKQTFD